jgi:predicted amidophosphoribosyltransferase
MSKPICSQCGEEMTRTEMVICESCERAFCIPCLPFHEPCATELYAEERVATPESPRRNA